MIPPVTESEPNVPVVIEPLPNLATLRQHLQADSVTLVTARVSSSVNASELRPKIAHIGHDRVDSDDEGDVLTNEALLLQERVSLEKLLCKQSCRIIACILLSITSFCGLSRCNYLSYKSYTFQQSVIRKVSHTLFCLNLYGEVSYFSQQSAGNEELHLISTVLNLKLLRSTELFYHIGVIECQQ